MTATVASGADHPLNQVGAQRTVDIIGKPVTKTVEEFNTTLEVYPVTRLHLTIVDTRDVPALWEAGWSGQTAEQARKVIGLLAHDELGQEWKRDWEGNYNDGPGSWMGPEGLRGQEARTNDNHLLSYKGRGAGYTIVEQTAA